MLGSTTRTQQMFNGLLRLAQTRQRYGQAGERGSGGAAAARRRSMIRVEAMKLPLAAASSPTRCKGRSPGIARVGRTSSSSTELNHDIAAPGARAARQLRPARRAASPRVADRGVWPYEFMFTPRPDHRRRHLADPEEHHQRARARDAEAMRPTAERQRGHRWPRDASLRPPLWSSHGFRAERGSGAALPVGGELLARECPPTLRARGGDATRTAIRARCTAQMAELGWIGLVVPEAYGGAGLGMLELALLCEQPGRAVVPGPFFSSAVLATLAILHGGVERAEEGWLPRAGGGRGGRARWRCSRSSDRHRRRRRDDARAQAARRAPVAAQSCSSPTRTSPTCCGRLPRRPGATRTGVTLFLVPRDTPGVKVVAAAVDRRHAPADEVALRERRAAEAPYSARAGGGWKAIAARARRRPRSRCAADSLGGAETRARAGGRLRQGARAVRPRDRLVPGGEAHRRRDGQRDRAGARAGLVRRLRGRRAAARGAARPRRWRRPRLSDVYSRVANRCRCRCLAASASPGSTTSTSGSSAPSGTSSPTATRHGIASGSRRWRSFEDRRRINRRKTKDGTFHPSSFGSRRFVVRHSSLFAGASRRLSFGTTTGACGWFSKCGDMI